MEDAEVSSNTASHVTIMEEASKTSVVGIPISSPGATLVRKVPTQEVFVVDYLGTAVDEISKIEYIQLGPPVPINTMLLTKMS